MAARTAGGAAASLASSFSTQRSSSRREMRDLSRGHVNQKVVGKGSQSLPAPPRRRALAGLVSGYRSAAVGSPVAASRAATRTRLLGAKPSCRVTAARSSALSSGSAVDGHSGGDDDEEDDEDEDEDEEGLASSGLASDAPPPPPSLAALAPSSSRSASLASRRLWLRSRRPSRRRFF